MNGMIRRPWTLVMVIVLAMALLGWGCAGTKAGRNVREGCAYLIEFQVLVALGTAVIPDEEVAFWAGFTYANLAHICQQIREVDERNAEKELAPEVETTAEPAAITSRWAHLADGWAERWGRYSAPPDGEPED